MPDHTYAISEIVGTSSDSLEHAIRNGISKAGESLRNLDWFEVTDIRGFLGHTTQIQHFQVTMKIGFRYED